jgi:hypothetical protein
MRRRTLAPPALVLALALALAGGPLARTDEPETVKVLSKYQPVIDRGLAWLAKQQFRDGHWEANQGAYPVPMTALAGLALLAEGSTPSQGKYAKQIDTATEYLLARYQRKTGLISRPIDVREQQRYMYAQGFATLFLAQVYGEETDERRRKELETVLTGAVDFIGKAQTSLGGWGYVSVADSRSQGLDDFDEGSVTITQLQALRACKNAGIVVPKEVIDKAKDYLKKSTVVISKDPAHPEREEAGVIYSLRRADNRIRGPLTAAGIACMFSAGEYKHDLAVKWLNYCQRHIPVNKEGRDTFHWEYTHFYYAQVLYTLGDDRHAQLRPDLAEEEKKGKPALLKWSRYRDVIFDYLASTQQPDGSWNRTDQAFNVGPVYTTALHLLIMQLDKGNLPIFQR